MIAFKLFRTLLTGGLLVFCIPFLTKASAYWLEVAGNGKINQKVAVKIFYGSINDFGIRVPDKGAELDLTGSFKLFVLEEDGKRSSIIISKNKDHWEGFFTPMHEGRFRIIGLNDQHPVIDRSAKGGISVKPVDYLYADYKVGQVTYTYPTPAQLLDIFVADTGKLKKATIFLKGKLCPAGSKIRIFNPDNWEKELVVDDHGEVCFFPPEKGLYIIRFDWTETDSGNFLGKVYENTRHRCNYFLLF
ncbi:hypothetical protein CKK33_01945 [Mucilaginibacter sp. MD40]|uniref:hypothetical protein n=1 Tax=Mucilaginibacter sp. MD40 TaxID=2029590 RepID=UPI000BACB12D|nr:hypothetical protein [Mucilaginibacter sp. MD40]PAW92319.1 hypothetical protein CKK33_01945 [Mucilaginibacter sp. MD40]